MKQTLRYFLSAVLLLVAAAGNSVFAQSEAKVLFDHEFSAGLGEFEVQNSSLVGGTYVEGLPQGFESVWTLDSKSGAMVASGHVGAVNYSVRGILFSPAISLKGYTECHFSFENSANYFGQTAEEAYDHIFYHAFPMAVACDKWDALFLPNIQDYLYYPRCDVYPTGMDNNYVTSVCNLSYLDDNEVYIALCYDSNDEINGVWSVKNLRVEGYNAQGVKEVIATIPGDALRYDLSGRRVGATTRGVVIANGMKVLK